MSITSVVFRMDNIEKFSYPTHIIINCDSDADYRISMRKLMSMKKIDIEIDDIDEVSKDECDFDPESTLMFLKKLYDETENNTDLMDLYVAAAGAFLSADPTTGIVVLFAYENLVTFHLCLTYYFEHPEDKISENEHYIALLTKMTK